MLFEAYLRPLKFSEASERLFEGLSKVFKENQTSLTNLNVRQCDGLPRNPGKSQLEGQDQRTFKQLIRGDLPTGQVLTTVPITQVPWDEFASPKHIRKPFKKHDNSNNKVHPWTMAWGGP